MRYWEDMSSKYGFSDGGAIPPDAEACREVYIKVVNGLLRKNGSKCRVIPFDRDGIHNPILYLVVDISAYNRYVMGISGLAQEIERDNQYYESLQEACILGLDDYVECKPVIDWKSLCEDFYDIMNENDPR